MDGCRYILKKSTTKPYYYNFVLAQYSISTAGSATNAIRGSSILPFQCTSSSFDRIAMALRPQWMKLQSLRKLIGLDKDGDEDSQDLLGRYERHTGMPMKDFLLWTTSPSTMMAVLKGN